MVTVGVVAGAVIVGETTDVMVAVVAPDVAGAVACVVLFDASLLWVSAGVATPIWTGVALSASTL
jgi:hypothetical protein